MQLDVCLFTMCSFLCIYHQYKYIYIYVHVFFFTSQEQHICVKNNIFIYMCSFFISLEQRIRVPGQAIPVARQAQ